MLELRLRSGAGSVFVFPARRADSTPPKRGPP